MELLSFVPIALGLSLDSLAIAASAGSMATRLSQRRLLQVGGMFGAVQVAMLLLGWWLGGELSRNVEGYEHWVVCVLFAGVGAKMIKDSFSARKKTRDEPVSLYGAQGWALSAAAGVDAIAIGGALGLYRLPIALPSVIVGIIGALMTIVGLVLGGMMKRVHFLWANWTGGLLFIAVGIRILLYHLP